MATRSGFLRRGVPSAVLFFALAGLADIRADQTVQVGPGIAFSPSTVTVAPGEAVIWDFQAFHTSTSDTSSGPEVWNSGFLSSGTFSHTFTTPGSYPYYCQVHSFPGGTAMNGVVIVSGAGVTPTETPTATATPTASPTPTSPPPTPVPAPASGIPTLDPAGTAFFALFLAASGIAALRIARSR
jgi:plastocyanin